MARNLSPSSRLRGLFSRGAPASDFSSPFLLSRRLNPHLPPEAERAAAGPVAVGEPADLDAPELNPRNLLLPPFSASPSVPIRDELKYGNFTNLPLSIGLASVRVLLKPPHGSRRTYLMIVNTHATQQLFITFGLDSSLLLGLPLMQNFGFYELENVIPQDDVYIIANGAATTGVLVYCNDSANAIVAGG
jgi:hypothetical protein